MISAAKRADRRTCNCRHKSEGVEKWQDAKHAVVRNEVINFANLIDIGHHVAMTQHDAFRLSGASTAENNGGEIVGGGVGSSEALQQAVWRGGLGKKSSPQLFAQLRVLDQILENMHPSGKIEFEPVHQFFGNDDVGDAALFDA